MGGIYWRACHTVIWLGPEGGDSNYALQLLETVHRLLEVTPDYAKPFQGVYEEVATRLATELADVSFLGACELGSSSLPGLATWIPA